MIASVGGIKNSLKAYVTSGNATDLTSTRPCGRTMSTVLAYRGWPRIPGQSKGSLCRQSGSSSIERALDSLAEQHAAELESARQKPDVVEISHPAVCNAKHHHRLKLFRHDSLPTIGSQVRRRKPKNCREFDVLRWRSNGIPEADVHLNLDSGLLQVGYQNNPHAAIIETLATSFPSTVSAAKRSPSGST